RHPALVAMETAALAGIAPGRVVLGLGSSNRRWIEAQMAIPFKTPLRGLREGVEIVRRLLDGERVTYAGEVFAVRDVALEAPPPAADLVTDDLVDTCAGAGTPSECRAALARWAQAGLDAAVAVVPGRTDLARQLEHIGRELAPAWKELRCR